MARANRARVIADSPNAELEAAVIAELGKLKTEKMPPDQRVKILNMAISWEKAKLAWATATPEDDYNPDDDEED